MVDDFTLINSTFTANGWNCTTGACMMNTTCNKTKLADLTLNVGIDDYFYRIVADGYTMDVNGSCVLSIMSGADKGYMVFGTQFMANYWI